jgi:ATP-binding cassette subfamily F protein 3
VISLTNRTLTKYSGGYSQYEQQYAEHQRQTNIAAGKQVVEAEKLQRFVDRFRAQATKAKQAQSRLKRLAKMQMIATFRPPLPFDFSFPEPDKMPDPLVTLVNASCGYAADKPILNKVTVEIRPGQRIGLLGQNGNGKSTLIKSLVGDLPLLHGERVFGKGTVIGYFAQHQVDTLHLDDTALSHFKRLAPREREQTLRNFLGRFGFAGEKVEQLIETFSGGEKARLALCCMIWLKPNLLLLDEPTNHLDLQCREALAEALIEFDGALVVVSHDRHLLESTTDQYMRVHAGAVTPFDGDLDDYNALVQSERSAANNAAKTPNAASNNTALKQNPAQAITQALMTGGSPKNPQLIERAKQLTKQLQQVEKKIEQLQIKIAEIDAVLNQPDAFCAEKQTQSHALSKDHQELNAQLLIQEELWLSLHTEIDDLDNK